MEIINHRSIFEKIVKMIILQQIKLKIKKIKKRLYKQKNKWYDIYHWSKKSFDVVSLKKIKNCKHFNIQCIIYYVLKKCLNCFFILLNLLLEKIKKK